MSLSSVSVVHSNSFESRLHSLAKKGEQYSIKGIQYDPHDLSKNSLLGFTLFRRIRMQTISIGYYNGIIYEFPLPQEYVPLDALSAVLKTALRMPDKRVFIMTVLSGKNCIHANLIVVNNQQKRIEIFDPLGKFDDRFREERDLQESICRLNTEYTLFGETLEFGIQVYDYRVLDSSKKKRREGAGFCRVWVWLVVQLCAEFPKKTLREIVGQLTEFSGQSINICRGFLAEMRERTCKMMQKLDARFSKLYLELREVPVQSGKARSAYQLSERMAMEYLRSIPATEQKKEVQKFSKSM